MEPPLQDRWHQLDQDRLTKSLETTLDGLSEAAANERKTRFGLNEIQGHGQTPWWQLLLEQFKNVLIIVLLIATALSAALGHAVEAIAIAVIVIFAILLSFIQNFRAEKAIERLRHLSAPNANVKRNGTMVSLPARELVPGDYIELAAGDRVPADTRLLSSINLQIDESALTGESVPSEKTDAPLDDENLVVGDQTNMAFSGTNVTYGRGAGIVVATGMKTQFGQIAKLLDTIDTSPTPLQKNLDVVGKRLAQAALVIVTLVGIIGVFRGQPILDTIVFAIALAVAVVPEALPAVVTISLAIGVQHLIKRNALIRRLPAVETLGSTSVICSDKTGTLTRDEMTVKEIFAAGESYQVTGIGYSPTGTFQKNGANTEVTSPLKELLIAGAIASDARLDTDTDPKNPEIIGDPTEGALIVAAAKAKIDLNALGKELPRIEEIPFSSETKRMITLHQAGEKFRACAKGAPETVLPLCSYCRQGDERIPLNQPQQEQILNEAQQLASKALRVLAIAGKDTDNKDNFDQELTFLGLVGMIDPPRSEAKDAIRVCREAGIKVVMITGDHPITAQAIARDLEITTGDRLINGVALEQLDDQQLTDRVEDIDVYARVSPAQKLRIVSALQRRQHITAMTGDGVNDAPALKKADLGIAMGITGTDVSKEAADMTLTDDNFVSIVGAIEEGRGIYANIKKYLAYLLSANIGEIGLIATASVMGVPVPLSAVQILYVNLATDGLPALALAVDPPEPDRMKQKPRDSKKGIFTKPLVSLMCFGGIWSSLVNLSVYLGALQKGYDQARAMTLTFVTLVMIQFLAAYCFRSTSDTVFRRPFANRWLNLAVVWELGLLFLVVHWGVLQAPFGTVDLTPTEWIVTTLAACTIVPALEVAKRIWGERTA